LGWFLIEKGKQAEIKKQIKQNQTEMRQKRNQKKKKE
jgi:hypothetical protein